MVCHTVHASVEMDWCPLSLCCAVLQLKRSFRHLSAVSRIVSHTTSGDGLCDLQTLRDPSHHATVIFKLRATAVCCGLRQCSIFCTHLAQRCVTTMQVTDNIFKIETAALAQCICTPGESGILIPDFACAYSSVNHGCIFLALERAGLLGFLQSFFLRIYNGSTTAVEHAGHVRPGCRASGFLFTMASDPIFWWVHDGLIPRNFSLPECLQLHVPTPMILQYQRHLFAFS